MRKFLAVCMVVAVAVFFTTAAHATLYTDLLKGNIYAKKLDWDGVTTLNDLNITQLTAWASADMIEINFDICPKQKGIGVNNIYYELPYTVDWSGVTYAPTGMALATAVTNVFAAGWGTPHKIVTLQQDTHPGLPIGDQARNIITVGEGSQLIVSGIRVIRNMFPCRPNHAVKLSVMPEASYFTASSTIGKYLARYKGLTALSILNPDPTKEDGVYWCNPHYYHPHGVIAATCTEPCITYLKFGFVLGTPDYVTVLMVASDLSTTCNDGVADTVEFYAWDDFGTYLGQADVPVGGDFLLNTGQKSATAIMLVGHSAYTWGGQNTWDSLNPGGIGQVIAKAFQPFAHGVAIILGPAGMATYQALQDPSITGIDASGSILRDDYYNYKEPYLGYIH